MGEIAFINGWGSDSRVWNKLLKRLKIDGYELLELADFFNDSVPGLSALSSYKNLVAWSTGAMLALEAACQENSRIEKLIIISGSIHFCNKDYGWPKRVIKRMIKQIDEDSCTVQSQFAKQMFCQAEYHLADDYNGTFLDSTKWPKVNSKNALKYLMEFNLKKKLSLLTAENLWIHGNEDKICPINVLSELPESSISFSLNASGHLPFWSNEKVIANEILEFLGRQ